MLQYAKGAEGIKEVEDSTGQMVSCLCSPDEQQVHLLIHFFMKSSGKFIQSQAESRLSSSSLSSCWTLLQWL